MMVFPLVVDFYIGCDGTQAFQCGIAVCIGVGNGMAKFYENFCTIRGFAVNVCSAIPIFYRDLGRFCKDSQTQKIGTILSLGDAIAKAKECHDGNENPLKHAVLFNYFVESRPLNMRWCFVFGLFSGNENYRRRNGHWYDALK
jgi:hypothetical protein